MMSAIMAFFGSGKIAVIVATAVAMIAFLWRLLAGAKKAGVDQQKVKEAVAREQARREELNRIKDAGTAAGYVHPDDVLSDDPYNRDIRKHP